MDNRAQQFEVVYRENIDRIYRFVYLKVSSEELAQDLTSKVFLKGWEAFQVAVNPIENPRAFLYQVARNMVIDYYRTKGNSKTVPMDVVPQLADEGAGPHEQAVLAADVRLVKEGIGKLKQEYQDVIIWHYLEDLPIKEVAKLAGKPEGTVRVMIHRGLKDLRGLVQEA